MTDPSLPDRRLITLPGISSRTWEHPADRAALSALRTLAGFDTLLSTLSGLFRERQHRLVYLANAVRVDNRQLRRIHDLRADCLSVLDMDHVPEVYVHRSPDFSAATLGMETPFIVLSSTLVEESDDDELRFILGHELGHLLSGHAVYRTMLDHLLRLSRTMGFVPVGGWILRAVIAGMLEWWRTSELTGDRAGLLCVQDEDVALRALMKTAGGNHHREMNVDAFLAQARDYDRSGDLRDGVLKLLNLELATHPFPVLRAAELRRWIDSGAYRRVLAGEYPRRGEEGPADLGTDFSEAAHSYREKFDASEDPLIRTLRDALGGVGRAAGAAAGQAAEGFGGLAKRFRKGFDGDGGGDGPDRDDTSGGAGGR